MTFEEKVTKAREMQQEIVSLENQKKNKIAEYNAFTKEHLGLVDGAQMSVVDLAEALVKLAKRD